MIIEKPHRRALLNELDKAKKDLEVSRDCLNSKETANIKEHFEIAVFLAQEKIELIEQSLIDNEIDF